MGYKHLDIATLWPTPEFQHVSAGLSQSSAWKGHVCLPAGRDWVLYLSADSPDGTCGATAALERGYEMQPDKVQMNEAIFRTTIKKCLVLKLTK